MKKLFYCAWALAMASVLMLTGCGSSEVADQSVDMSVRRIATENAASTSDMLEEARSAVVGISVSYPDGYAIGSGVAISDGGLILTNNHVVEDGKKITLYYADKTTGQAKLMWSDAGLDLAIISSSKVIPYLGIETSVPQIGEEVFTLGTPLTLEFKHTVTHGIVSAINRTLETETSSGVSFLQSLIQHDAPINPGNSGGPLINSRGQVIGINTLKATEGEGIGFAIPIETASLVVEKLKQNPNYQSAYLGIFGFDSDVALANGQNLSSQGVYTVSTDGPAAKAGIQKGDLVVKVGDYNIDNLLSLRKSVFAYNKGDNVLVKFVRDGQMKEALVTLK